MTTATLLNIDPDASASVTAVIAMPVGTIVSYAGGAEPNGWLLCNGQGILPSMYPALTALIGNTVPDLRSRFIVGAGQGPQLDNYPLMATGGAESVALSIAELPAHTHTINSGNIGLHHRSFRGASGSERPFQNSGYSTGISGTDSTGQGQSHENRPPYYALTYIIKY
jgi:microcystin-dependent protein